MNNELHKLVRGLATVLLVAIAGCSHAETDAREKERARIEEEKRALKEIEQGNDAITEINRQLGRQVAPLDLHGSPVPSEVTPAPKP